MKGQSHQRSHSVKIVAEPAARSKKLGVDSAASRNFGNIGDFTLKLDGNELTVLKNGSALCSGQVKDQYLSKLARPSRKLLGLAALITVSDRMKSMLDNKVNIDYLRLISYHMEIDDLFVEMRPEVLTNIDGPRELFEGRNVEEASAFLRRVYADKLAIGTLYQHELRKMDPKLMQALSNEFAGRREKLRELLPPKKEQTDNLLREAGIAPDSPVRRAAVAALRRQSGPQ